MSDRLDDVYEITLSGFDGDTDDSDDLVVWVRGEEAVVRALVDGTDAEFCGPVEGVTEADAEDSVDFHLPGDSQALLDRIAENDRRPVPASSPYP